MDPHQPKSAPSGRPEGKSVGEAARALGVAAHVLRHWEDERVLIPQRDARGHRRYSDGDLALAEGIRRAQRAGLTLAQIRQFLSADAEARAALLEAHRDRLLVELDRLRGAADTVVGILAEPPAPACPYGLDPPRDL